ncbi:MAG: hypothetical protein ACP5RD_03650 [bacterium]|jgi:hypothetical protein
MERKMINYNNLNCFRNRKGLVNILIISFLVLGIIISFLSLVSTLNLFVNRFNYEYLYSSFYVADSYIVRFSTSTNGNIIIKSVPYNTTDPIINFGSANLNSSLVNANVYTFDNNYKQLRFYINYSGSIYYQIDKITVY